jgi:hypothetical protein
LVSALASRSGGVTIIAALSLVMGPLGPLVGAIWLRRRRKPWFWINLDREAQITPGRPTDVNVKLRGQRSPVLVEHRFKAPFRLMAPNIETDVHDRGAGGCRSAMPMCENCSQSSRTEMARRSSTMSMTR